MSVIIHTPDMVPVAELDVNILSAFAPKPDVITDMLQWSGSCKIGQPGGDAEKNP
jgi:hypothetical protein